MKNKISNKHTYEEWVKNPDEYLQLGFFKNPKLKDITKKVLDEVIKKRPVLFFHYNVDKEPGFEYETNNAALGLIDNDPLSALFIYRFHEQSKFSPFWILLLQALLNEISDVDKVDENLLKEIKKLANNVAKEYPDFASKYMPHRVESGESEYNPN